MKEDGKQITQALYNAILLILNNYDRSDVFVVFLELLGSSMTEVPLAPKYVDCLVKCLVKLAKTLGATIQTLDLVKILVGLNDFFVNTPKDLSGQLPCEPHRMIKTILNEIVRLQGDQLHSFLEKAFPGADVNETPVCAYSQQFLAAQNKQNGGEAPVATPVNTQTSPVVSLDTEEKQKLLEIFKKVRSSDPESSKVALLELYHFQKVHPSADFAPFLEKTSQTFRDHIEQSLASIAKEEEIRATKATPEEPRQSPTLQNPASSTVIQAAPSVTEQTPISLPEPVQQEVVQRVPLSNLISDPTPGTSSSDLAESYMEKLTRLRSKYNSRG